MAECAARQRTTLTTYFVYNAQNVDGQNVVYVDFLADHVWKIRENFWSTQHRGEKAVGRIYFVHFVASEHFFLHLLLIIIPSATSFKHLQIVDDTEHLSFQATCKALGLL